MEKYTSFSSKVGTGRNRCFYGSYKELLLSNAGCLIEASFLSDVSVYRNIKKARKSYVPSGINKDNSIAIKITQNISVVSSNHFLVELSMLYLPSANWKWLVLILYCPTIQDLLPSSLFVFGLILEVIRGKV